MVDIHSHILPGVDDGSPNIDESIKMARNAVKEGIHTIYATPHHLNGRYDNKKESILCYVHELNRTLQIEKIPLKVLPGQEIRVRNDVIELYKYNEILTLNNTETHILIELPSNQVPRFTKKLFFELSLSGLTPIIVHPERNQEIVQNPELLYEFIQNGALSQITAGSILGNFGKKIETLTKGLIKNNLTHFIASDAHNTSSRSFHLAEALDFVEKNIGLETVELYLHNAENIAKGKKIYIEPPCRYKKKKFFGLL